MGIRGRHAFARVVCFNTTQQFAPPRGTWHNCNSSRPNRLYQILPDIQAQSGLASERLRTVALPAVLGEDGRTSRLNCTWSAAKPGCCSVITIVMAVPITSNCFVPSSQAATERRRASSILSSGTTTRSRHSRSDVWIYPLWWVFL